MSKILYIKAEQCIQVSDTNVKLGDVVKLECTDTTVVNRLKTEKLFTINSSPNHRIAVSIMAVIQKIHEVFPELEVIKNNGWNQSFWSVCHFIFWCGVRYDDF